MRAEQEAQVIPVMDRSTAAPGVDGLAADVLEGEVDIRSSVGRCCEWCGWCLAQTEAV
ncbi:hypothetical protein GCM10009583_17800 [Ornithinicoccus hortensis]